MSDRTEVIAADVAELPALSGAAAELRFGAIQRRQLSIMFVDLAGSTEITNRFDVEEVRDLLLGFLEASAARIEAAHGFLARFMGDGLLAYFGYPVAHAEAAALAVHAGLEIQKVVSQLRLPDGTQVQARIGIATGEVMIGDIVGRGLASECMVVGEAANLAARLQAAALPGTTFVCETTRSLLGQAFALEQAEPLALKGFAEQVQAWSVTGSRAADRFASRVGLGLAPLAGRDTELAALSVCRHNARQGLQRIVIAGEPGIGKSRLLHALRDQALAAGHRWLFTSGAATSTQTPYFGLRQLIERLLKSGRTNPARRTSRLTAAARWLGLTRNETRAMAATLGLSQVLQGIGHEAHLATVSGQLPALCARFMRRAAQRNPIVLAIEDGHWLDGSSRQLLVDLLPLVADLPVLIALTSRTGAAAPFPDWPQLALAPLSSAAVAEVVQHAAGGLLDPAALAEVLQRSQGNALFAEELARLLARGQSGGAAQIPNSLADLLLSRVDQGKDGLAVAQAIALLGTDAQPSAIAVLAGREASAVLRAVDTLVTDGVLIQSGEPGRAPAFRHALFGESAYAAMPVRSRATMHCAAARLLMEAQAPASRIADHFDRGKDLPHAAEWWQRAGHLARRQRALPEARSAYERAMVLAAQLPANTPDRQAHELTLQSHYFEVLQLSFGYSAAETIAAGSRLRELVEQQGDLQQQLTAVTGEWAAASSAGEYDLANQHAARAPIIARALGTPDALAAAAMIQLTARYRCGDLLGAEEAFAEGVLHFFDPQFYRRSGAIAQTYGNAAINAWLVGDEAAARERIAVLAEAQARHSDSYSQAFAQHMASMAWLVLDELPAAEQAARAALTIAEKAGFPQYEAIARITLGAALCGQGASDDGLDLMRDGLRRMETTRSRAAITLYHAWLGRAEHAAGQTDRALGTVQRGLIVCPQERYVVPELLRLRAVMEAATGRAALAAQLLDEARSKAMAMGALGLIRVIAGTHLQGPDDAEATRRSA